MSKAELTAGIIILVVGLFLIPTSKIVRGVETTEFEVFGRTNTHEAILEVRLSANSDYKAIVYYTSQWYVDDAKLKISYEDYDNFGERRRFQLKKIKIQESGIPLNVNTKEYYGNYRFEIETTSGFSGYSLEIGQDVEKMKIEYPYENLFLIGCYNIVLGLAVIAYALGRW